MKKTKRESKIEINPVLENAIKSRAQESRITCAAAMKIAKETGVEFPAVGRMLDQMEIRLIECQLGLFGAKDPQNRKVQAAQAVSAGLEEEIRRALQNGCLSCAGSWMIARKTKITKKKVSAACEYLKIKIKPCQLGAF